MYTERSVIMLLIKWRSCLKLSGSIPQRCSVNGRCVRDISLPASTARFSLMQAQNLWAHTHTCARNKKKVQIRLFSCLSLPHFHGRLFSDPLTESILHLVRGAAFRHGWSATLNPFLSWECAQCNTLATLCNDFSQTLRHTTPQQLTIWNRLSSSISEHHWHLLGFLMNDALLWIRLWSAPAPDLSRCQMLHYDH